jgi:hypothetical protein
MNDSGFSGGHAYWLHHFCHTTHPTSDNPCSNNGLDGYASSGVESGIKLPTTAVRLLKKKKKQLCRKRAALLLGDCAYSRWQLERSLGRLEEKKIRFFPNFARMSSHF